MNFKDNISYCLNILLSFTLIGCSLVWFMPDQLVFGYTWVSLSLVSMLTVLWALISPEMMQSSWLNVLKNTMSHSLPIVIVVILLFWVISLRMKYSTRFMITNDDGTAAQIPELYHSFEKGTNMLVLLECLSIYNFVKLKFSNFNMSADQNDSIINKTYKHLSSQQRGLLYLFILIHFIMVSIMNNILKNYMTDG